MPDESTPETPAPTTEEWLTGLTNDQLVTVLIEVSMERSNSTFSQRALARAEVMRRFG